MILIKGSKVNKLLFDLKQVICLWFETRQCMIQIIVSFEKNFDLHYLNQKSCDSSQWVLWFEPHTSMIWIKSTYSNSILQVSVWFESSQHIQILNFK